MKIKATEVNVKELEPGDFFSHMSGIYWDEVSKQIASNSELLVTTESVLLCLKRAVGENYTVYKLEIIK